MADNELQITFSGDASGVKSAIGDAAAAIQALTPSIQAVSKAMEQFQRSIAAAFAPPAVNGVATAANQAADAGAGAARAYADLAQVAATAQGTRLSAAQALTAALALENAKRDASDAQSARAMQQRWSQTVTPIVDRFGQGLLQMAEGTKSFGQVMTGVGQQILEKWVQNIAKSVSTWLEGEVTKTAASQAGAAQRTAAEESGALQSRLLSLETAEKDILNSAAKAAGAAFNAFASNPLTLAFAPVAAATAFAAVEAFGNLTSAAGGYDIPSGVNPLVQAHAEEMILPARIANPLRSVLSDVGGPRPSAFGDGQGGGGGVSFTAQIHALDGKSVQQFFDKHSDHLVRTLRGAHRRGALTGVFA
jgi:hypothetical protein